MMDLPYAPATTDEFGEYAVICPVCRQLCSGSDATELTDEDRVTKGAGIAYAQHYEANHRGGTQ